MRARIRKPRPRPQAEAGQAGRLPRELLLSALNFEPDQVWQIIKLFSDDVKKALQLSLGQRIISPNGLIWQHSILSQFVEYPLSRTNYEKQISSLKPSIAEIYTEYLTPEVRNLELVDYSPILLDKDDVIFDVET